ncbi:penicillin-binding transpeptidase domain-containing protein [Sphaerisporangium perillae]|uniref:penicillin-binding transpeptidase domain-containing protein n=1 Tax=Sphaerisporangium perillae TaxID=2935860 RepID=UPI00200CECA7|nr:penicillin-binding transpeptidase domain-containing protein [Sphaerisporangium perillae]
MRTRWPLAMVAAVLLMVAFGAYAMLTAPDPVDASRPSSRRTSLPLHGAEASPPAPPATTTAPAPGQALTTAAPAPEQALTFEPTPAASIVPTQSQRPEPVAASYFTAWRSGDFTTMASLVEAPPADFADRHRRFSAELRVASLSLTPGSLRLQGQEAAEVPFQGVRQVTGLGRWEFSSVLRLGLRSGAWKVLWAPETLHPSLKDGGGLRLKETQVARPAALTREGRPFPADSRAGDYFPGLGATGVRLTIEEVPSGRVLLASPATPQAATRTTISEAVQTAAARALDGVERPAAVVAVDVQSGQVRAVADTLGGKRAFNGLYPPGSAFKVVTAAALLRSGLTPESQVACPGSYTIPNGRSFHNDGNADHGTVTLTTAFALSCNTTFVRQAYERLRDDRLRAEAADRFGFREKPGLSSCRIRPYKEADELGSDAIGQNSVQGSPLCMAEVAAAVAGGVWRPAIMAESPPADSPAAVPLDAGVVAGLRTMMSAVVTQGTAAKAGLPSGTAGKTGTAEVQGASAHAWFIGYRDSLAFAVFVQNGGSGGAAAAPIAARFLKAL